MMFDNIKVYIQAIEKRKVYIDEYIVPELHKYGFADIHVMYDKELNGPMFNLTQIMQDAIKQDKTHFLVLQDDVIIGEHFGEHVSDLMTLNIGAISLFCPPRKQYLIEMQNGTRLYTEKNFLWIQAMLYQKRFMFELYTYSIWNPEKKHDDVLVGKFAKDTKNYVRVTIPSLVQHNLNIQSSLGTATKIGNTKRETQVYYPVKPHYFI